MPELKFMWVQNGQILTAVYDEKFSELKIYDDKSNIIMIRQGVSKKQFNNIRELKSLKVMIERNVDL